MKRILTIIMLMIMVLINPINVNAKVDDYNLKNSSITLKYYYDDYNFDNINTKLYFIADLTDDLEYQLSSNFSNYSLNINDLTNDNQLRFLKDTIDTYIINDNIKETVFQTIKNNTINFTNLKPGLYFIKTNKYSNKGYSYIFDTSLINVPTLTEDGEWIYDINIYPKIEKQINDNPDTGDNINLYIYLLIGSFIGIIVLIGSYIFKKFKVKNNS